MTFARVTQFGVYQITDPLGVVGMGEVYRATNSNLKREVVIKSHVSFSAPVPAVSNQ